MRACEVVWGPSQAEAVRGFLAAAGVRCAAHGEPDGCRIMGDWGQRARLAGSEPLPEVDITRYELAG